MTVEERAYQTRALASARSAFAKGHRAVLLVAPTGAGKTTIAGMIAVSAVAKGSRVVFSAHRRELIDQAARRFRSLGLEVGCRGEGRTAKVQITSPHIILARRQMPEAELVILDEAHHYVAAEWGKISQTYLKTGSKLIGLSATPERGDGIGLGGLFDSLVVVAQIRELTELGFLVPCEVMVPTESCNLALEPWEAYARHASGRKAVVFAPHVKAAEDFAGAFRENGIPTAVVHGKLDDDTRDARLRGFEDGSYSVMVNVMVLTEGWDSPIADVCILAKRDGSPLLYLQKVGRVLRPHPGKTRALLIDLAGNVDAHGYPDEEREWSLDGAACSRMGPVVRDGVRHCRSCSAEIPEGDTACPQCLRPLPVQKTPRGQGVDLQLAAERAEKQEAKAALPEDKRIGILASIYAKGIRRGWQKRAAHHAYKGMTGRFPDAALMASAWERANETVATERGDAWLPAE